MMVGDDGKELRRVCPHSAQPHVPSEGATGVQLDQAALCRKPTARRDGRQDPWANCKPPTDTQTAATEATATHSRDRSDALIQRSSSCRTFFTASLQHTEDSGLMPWVLSQQTPFYDLAYAELRKEQSSF